MAKAQISEKERFERAGRADRLKQARIAAGFRGVKSASAEFRWNVNNYKAHESGQNGFSSEQAKVYAEAYRVSLTWLWFGTGSPDDPDAAPPGIIDVPMISMVSAGQLAAQDAVLDLQSYPTVPAIDLPEGQWVAMRVEGASMNKISPPESVIFVNLNDTRLVQNACYIVADETGAATYKRYRMLDKPPFQPASYEDIPAPVFQGSITVIGRVRRSVIEM